jgi:hypothetical protein
MRKIQRSAYSPVGQVESCLGQCGQSRSNSENELARAGSRPALAYDRSAHAARFGMLAAGDHQSARLRRLPSSSGLLIVRPGICSPSEIPLLVRDAARVVREPRRGSGKSLRCVAW